MPDLSQNIRYLLWKKGVDRFEWPAKFAEVVGCAEDAAENLLSGGCAILGDKELKALANFAGVEQLDLTSKDLLVSADLNLFHENLSFLIDLLPHGEKQHFAQELGVDATTISRWKSGAQRPTKNKLKMVRNYFGVEDDVILEETPLFLSVWPIGVFGTKRWLHRRIEKLDKGAIRLLYPALKRLLTK